MSNPSGGASTPSETVRPAELTRRRVLTVGAAALAVGAIGAERTDGAAGAAIAPSGPVPPDVDLMEEHGVLKRVLLIYQEASDRIVAGQATPIAQIHEGALVIHDFIEGFHEALEEGYIFPQLTRAGLLVSTVDTLYVQHARGRSITQFLLSQTTGNQTDSAQTAGALDAFVRMYQPHEAREDTVIFPTYRSIHSATQLNELATTFQSLERQQFGHNGFNYFVSKVAEIEMSLGIYDLNQFTAEQMNT
jgi:hemerythrin-like domain-containing protein